MKRQLTDQEQQELDMLSRTCLAAANAVDNGYTSAVKWATQPGLTDEQYEEREESLSGRYDLHGNER